MSRTNTGVIDLITKPLPGDDCDLVLYIVDSGEVKDEIKRFKLLLERLQSYIVYVASDDFVKKYPTIEPRRVLIKVVCKTEPNEAMLDVQAVKARHDERIRIPITFIRLDEFLNGLEDRRNLPEK